MDRDRDHDGRCWDLVLRHSSRVPTRVLSPLQMASLHVCGLKKALDLPRLASPQLPQASPFQGPLPLHSNTTVSTELQNVCCWVAFNCKSRPHL